MRRIDAVARRFAVPHRRAFLAGVAALLASRPAAAAPSLHDAITYTADGFICDPDVCFAAGGCCDPVFGCCDPGTDGTCCSGPITGIDGCIDPNCTRGNVAPGDPRICTYQCVACPNALIPTLCPDPSPYGPICTNLTRDPNNCGTCGNACPTGQVCGNGQCVACASGRAACGHVCCARHERCKNRTCIRTRRRRRGTVV